MESSPELIDNGERLHVESCTQLPQVLRSVLAGALGIGLDRVRVTAPRLGGGFGCKEMVYPEEILVPAVARKLQRPVRWLEDRREHFASATHAREETIDAEAVVAPDGTVSGLRLRGWSNIGAAYALRGQHADYGHGGDGAWAVSCSQSRLHRCTPWSRTKRR